MSATGVNQSSLFSPYSTVPAWQMGMREMGTALFEDIRKSPLGDDNTHVYGELAVYQSFLDWKGLSSAPAEIQKVADFVRPIMASCFAEIAKANHEFNQKDLKNFLWNKLDQIKGYPKNVNFPLITDHPALEAIKKQGLKFEGTYGLWDKKPNDEWRNSFTTISQTEFLKVADACSGLKKAGDKLSSTPSGVGHITNMSTQELATNYAKVIAGHNKFTKTSDKATLSIIGFKEGCPQKGRLSRVFMAVFAVDNLEAYRKECGLGPMEFPPCMTIFSQEVPPHAQLKGMTLAEFAAKSGSAAVLKLSADIEAYTKKMGQSAAASSSNKSVVATTAVPTK